ncbi:MAG TPA: phosphotransferase [Pirellulaceae bacterium]|nr:phosphotransferase [Pirellulaceae bacterium]
MATDALAVLSYYSLQPPLVRRLQPLGNAGGWSGSRLWRVWAADDRQLCLRRHPESWRAPDRLRFIHRVLQHVHAGGLSVVPVPLVATSGATIIQHNGYLWELTPWMPGIADFHSHPTRERLRSALQTLARFHLLAVTDGVPPVDHNLAPALIVRSVLRDIGRRADRLTSHLQPILGNELNARAPRLLELVRARGTEIGPAVLAAVDKPWFLQPSIRDIWHDHVLFSGDEVTGIVDFGAMNVDTPLTDIARLVGSLVADDAAARNFALDAYSEIRPLTDDDRQLIDLLDHSGTVLAGLNWLTWLYAERRDMGPIEPIIRRLHEILARLETMPVR